MTTSKVVIHYTAYIAALKHVTVRPDQAGVVVAYYDGADSLNET